MAACSFFSEKPADLRCCQHASLRAGAVEADQTRRGSLSSSQRSEQVLACARNMKQTGRTMQRRSSCRDGRVERRATRAGHRRLALAQRPLVVTSAAVCEVRGVADRVAGLDLAELEMDHLGHRIVRTREDGVPLAVTGRVPARQTDVHATGIEARWAAPEVPRGRVSGVGDQRREQDRREREEERGRAHHAGDQRREVAATVSAIGAHG